MTLSIVDGYLNVHVMAARNIPRCGNTSNTTGPDTYVKTLLREEDRRFLKKKSRVVTSTQDPFYNHRVRFLTSDLPRR